MMQANQGYCGCGMNDNMQQRRQNPMGREVNTSSANRRPAMGDKNQQQLMDLINQCSFALNDVLLFLDTHPCDQEALSYFQHFHQIRLDALAEYARKYTPLTLDSISSCQDQWEWVYGKWPWEGGSC